MEIWEVIEKISKYPDRHRMQMKYDLGRERIYELGGAWIASMHPKKVLDVGCAYGTMAYILRKIGIEVDAIDIMPELHSKKMFKEMGIKFEKRNIETNNIKEEYDCVIFTDVLEHLCYNPLPVLKKLAKISKGILISTPAKEVDGVCEGKWCDEINWRQIPKFKDYKFEDGHHHTYYLWELQELLAEAGFEIVESQLLPVEATWMILAQRRQK